ncbi:nucleoside 2-deoxyribosyltransferase [Leuconostoc gelidum subsp. gasicomitatum]|nr:hypothetical protein C269_01170 [Leuconostoc gelidum JB7]MBR2276789.1 nucleoside 2-deoxyribosyltransferase [Leuconostoc sp.]MBZ5953744.1 nucleoside 2-deoxyribosyltransferase [Leuconostoc gasicomitatum]MBZ5955215.1 nucleoside 2-deoxyribosyltransferase [Leuconostoc gasicomitatum]MBZ5987573.1 nucleoside 2-deoxyribosyltransferase [Leuconostoc gasicomitatum]
MITIVITNAFFYTLLLNLGGHFLNKHIFLAAPFKQLLTAEQVIDSRNKNMINKVIQLLENQHFIVDNAHKRENWGRNMMSPNQCTHADFQAIKSCQLFMAFPGTPASPGTHIEIGWASACEKQMVLLLQKDTTYAYLVTGLGAIGNVTYLYYADAADCLSQIQHFLD